MDVRFGSEQLARAYQQERLAIRLWGQDVARSYVRRVDALYQAENAQMLRESRSLRLHALKGAYAGKHALYLLAQWRLIVTFSGEQTTTVTVEEVSNHYGD